MSKLMPCYVSRWPAAEDRDIRRYRENSLMRHGKGHSVGALRLRANDRLWKYILAALRSG
jgi:hypothetical protein